MVKLLRLIEPNNKRSICWRTNMKVLIINHSPFIGSGSGIYTMNIAKSLKNAGQEVEVITSANSLDFPNMEGIKVHPIFFENNYKAKNVINFNVPCFDQYPTSDVLFYDLTKEQLQTYIGEFRKVLEQEVKEFKPDIIHTQHLWIWSSIVGEYGIPVVVTSHGSDMMGYDIDNSFGSYCLKTIRECKKIITISKKNNEIVTNRFPEAREKVITLKNGYDSNMFYLSNFSREEILKEFKIDKRFKKIVLFAGRLTENKGIDILLKAAAKYENNDTLTIIAGGRGTIRNIKKSGSKFKIKKCYICRGSSTREFK